MWRTGILSNERLYFPAANTCTIMSTKARESDGAGNAVVATRPKNHSSGRVGDEPLSPVQRRRGRIRLANPELVRRIISDPSLEP